jgi:cobyric acid synthase
MTARAVMVLGTTSGAGKSWLATALCRWYARRGLKVAPFRAQNMSNNARVVPGLEGRLGEIGSAQYFQALAARAAPDVRMNPVLLKPERDTASQVVLMGEVRADLAGLPWHDRSALLWPHARNALHALQAAHDVVVIEGAGSPAEINLRHSDYVNMRTALAADAACLLVSDIDRGGAFAHLYGTHQLLAPDEQRLLRGFVLNRFRGDARLLEPGPSQLQQLTGVPTLAVLPMWRGHGLPEEDGVFDDTPSGDADGLRISVIAPPRISNLDEFQPLRHLSGVRLRWARTPAALADADWIVLPGSKHTSSDLAWLRPAGARAVRGLADARRIARRPVRHRRRCGRPRAAAAGHALRAREAARHHRVSLRDAGRAVGCAVAGCVARLRDPPRPHAGHRAARRRAAQCRRRADRLAARQRARALCARRVRMRRGAACVVRPAGPHARRRVRRPGRFRRGALLARLADATS